MTLKNYTSDVPISRTIARIEEKLAESGAEGIMKEYDSGRLIALSFRVTIPANQQKVSVRLPANVDAVYEALAHEVRRPRDGTLARVREQAERTAWKLMQDWVEVQLSLIAMQQAEFLQVFLPYVLVGQRTIYDRAKADGFRFMLPEKSEAQ